MLEWQKWPARRAGTSPADVRRSARDCLPTGGRGPSVPAARRLMSLATARERANRWQARRPLAGVPVGVVKKFIDDDAARLSVNVAY